MTKEKMKMQLIQQSSSLGPARVEKVWKRSKRGIRQERIWRNAGQRSSTFC